MAWVPKRSPQSKSDMPAPVSKPAGTKDKRKADRSRQDPGHPYSSTMPAPVIKPVKSKDKHEASRQSRQVKPAGAKKETREAGRISRQLSYHYRRFQDPCHPCSSTVPSKPPCKNLSPAETSELFRLFTLWWVGSQCPLR